MFAGELICIILSFHSQKMFSFLIGCAWEFPDVEMTKRVEHR